MSTEANKTGAELSRAIPAAGTQGQVPKVWAGSTRPKSGKTSNLRDRWLVGIEGLFLDPRKDARTECRTPVHRSPGERTSLETGACLSTLPLLYRLQREPSALKPSLREDKNALLSTQKGLSWWLVKRSPSEVTRTDPSGSRLLPVWASAGGQFLMRNHICVQGSFL